MLDNLIVKGDRDRVGDYIIKFIVKRVGIAWAIIHQRFYYFTLRVNL